MISSDPVASDMVLYMCKGSSIVNSTSYMVTEPFQQVSFNYDSPADLHVTCLDYLLLVWHAGLVTQYPIPAITVPGRMRYSRHKRSGISYGCHNESPRTTFSCHKRSCLAISYPLSRIYCRCRMYRRFGVGVSADDCSLLPPPNGSSMAMQINARTHSEPFMATKSFHIPPPQTFYANAIFPHTLDLLWQ